MEVAAVFLAQIVMCSEITETSECTYFLKSNCIYIVVQVQVKCCSVMLSVVLALNTS